MTEIVTIYCIKCKDPKIKEIYVGSTNNYKQRQRGHRSNCINRKREHYGLKVYQFIRNNGGFENWEFKILNEVEFIDDGWKRRQEQCYIDCMNPSLNYYKAFSTEEETKERINEYRKEYRKNNAEKIKESKRDYRKNNAEKLKESRREHYKNNKEKINERRRKRYLKKKLEKEEN